MNNALIESQIAMKTGGISNTSLIVDQWPEFELEQLGCCPVCGDKERSVLFSGLADTVAKVAPGKWTLWQCGACGSGYLDPRPSLLSIGRAYENYYTHQMISDTQEGKQSVPIGWIARKRRELKADYMNRQYGFALSPSLSGGAMLIKLMSKLRVSIDYWMRHLPAPANEGERLLDVGCANGSFLSGAKRLGYDNWGLEPDPKSADFARRLGFTVQVGGLPNSGLPKGSFAQITLDHVFEHLHYSLDALREINTLLKPGGRLWLRFPNINSQGLQMFGGNWIGLDPPRHLVLPSIQGMLKLLEKAELVDIELLKPQHEARGYFLDSLKLVEGKNAFSNALPEGWGRKWEKEARNADRWARRDPEIGESLTFVAFKRHT